MEKISSNLVYGGEQLRYKHHSAMLKCDMHFSIFLPPQAKEGPVPQVYWLSGLTCTDENFVQKAGAQRYAAETGIAIIAPDTSPRGEHVPDDAAAGWDFGLGAGFYVDATENPWQENYNMYSYVTAELPALVNDDFPVEAGNTSIMGHSMGGHGALIASLKNPGMYRSVSAFAPICAPTQCPWGHKALGNYLGDNKKAWQEHDSVELIKHASERLPLLIDQGDADDFLAEQLKPELIDAVCSATDHPLTLRMQPGYDHSYFFISTFIQDHIAWHAKALKS